MTDYAAFLEGKSQHGADSGFEPLWLPDWLYPFQRALVEWAIRKGRAAIFADCGLGKTPMALVWAENVARHTNKPVLIMTPLAVGGQMIREAEKFGIEASRSRDGAVKPNITISNYEKLHLFSPDDFGGFVGDESSIIKHFTGATQKTVTRFMLKIPYRLLDTATAAPNDYIELGTSSEALGELGYSDMLGRFFRQTDNKPHRMQEIKEWRAHRADGNHFGKLSFRVHQSIGQWRLKGHAATPFWRWVCSWARACRKPSDLGFPDDRFVLPELIEREHIITPRRPADGMLFTLPAFGLKEERDERRRTLDERCEFVADLVKGHDYSVAWCHLNEEGRLLEKLIPYSIEVAGRHDDDYKETVAEWFIGARCICSDSRFSAKLAAWHEHEPTRQPGDSAIDSTLSTAPIGGRRDETEKRTAPICGSTTGSIPRNSGLPQSVATQRTQGIASVIEPIRNIEPLRRRRSSPTGNGARRSGGHASFGDSGSRLNDTTPCSSSNGAVARSAGEALEINEPLDSTSITATQRDSFAGFSAPIATSASESSGMMLSDSPARPCMCGRVDGPRRLISKARVFGFGLNLQHCNHVVTFATHSWEQFYQSVRRCWRFGQTRPVTVDIVSTEGEGHVRENMMRKERAADMMFSQLVEQMGLAQRIERVVDRDTDVEIPSWL